jgi:hypothetical protein
MGYLLGDKRTGRVRIRRVRSEVYACAGDGGKSNIRRDARAEIAAVDGPTPRVAEQEEGSTSEMGALWKSLARGSDGAVVAGEGWLWESVCCGGRVRRYDSHGDRGRFAGAGRHTSMAWAILEDRSWR